MKILLTTLAAAFLALSVGGAAQAGDHHDSHRDRDHDRRDYDRRDRDRRDYDHDRDYDRDWWYYDRDYRYYDRDYRYFDRDYDYDHYHRSDRK